MRGGDLKRESVVSVVLIVFVIAATLMPATPAAAGSISGDKGQPAAQAAATAAPQVQAGAQGLVLHLQTPEYQLTTASSGLSEIKAAGYGIIGEPGDPALPGQTLHVALPPDVAPGSVRVELLSSVSVTLPGNYKFAPVPPPVTYINGQAVLSYGSRAAQIADGKNSAVYAADAWYPAAVAGQVSLSQMRKWRIANLPYRPFQYDPISGQVKVTTQVDLRISYQHALLPQGAAGAELADSLMDGEAAGLLFNYAQARSWYAPAPSLVPASVETAQPRYVIITTNAIAAGSLKLNAFVTNLQGRGFTVQIVTETQYAGLTGQAPNGTAEKIRQWLKNNYLSLGIKYVLLIGNPNPASGDVPMKMMYPRNNASDGYDESPSDYFYADLTGNWDLNGDGIFGEHSRWVNGQYVIKDDGVGGVDFAPEVYVGRIPVYTGVAGWGTTLDSILQKIGDYAASNDTDWRKAALLPMSFSDSSTDGAAMGEAMKSDYLNSLGFATTTLYQHKGTGCNSATASSANLTAGATKTQWQTNDYGLVTWWGHGSEVGAYVGYGGCSDGSILTSYDIGALDNAHPSVVFQNSCSNGSPENSNNLGYMLLVQGAVGTVSASRVSWYAVGSWFPEIYWGDNATIGYAYSGQVAQGATLGQALYDTKNSVGAGWGGETWMNLMDFNLYGDPATSLYSCKVTPAFARPLAYPQSYAANLCPGADADYYKFSGTQGDKLVIDIDANVNGSQLDSDVALLSADGQTVLGENDDDGITIDSKLGLALPYTGTYYIRVSDYSGHVAGGSAYAYWLRLYTDNTAPASAAITSPLPGTWLNPTQASVVATASDAESGIQRIDFYWRGAASTFLGTDTYAGDGWSLTFSSLGLSEGSGYLEADAYDYGGNVRIATATNLGIDHQPPTGSVTLGMQGANDGTVTLQISASDALSGVAAMRISNKPSFSDATWQPFSATLLWPTPPALGVFLQLRDNAGNLSGIYCSNPDCPKVYIPSINR
jgi:hypothetical protein